MEARIGVTAKSCIAGSASVKMAMAQQAGGCAREVRGSQACFLGALSPKGADAHDGKYRSSSCNPWREGQSIGQLSGKTSSLAQSFRYQACGKDPLPTVGIASAGGAGQG